MTPTEIKEAAPTDSQLLTSLHLDRIRQELIRPWLESPYKWWAVIRITNFPQNRRRIGWMIDDEMKRRANTAI